MATRVGVLARDVVRHTRGHDLALYSAGITFYAAVAGIPLLLITVYLAGLVVGQDEVRTLVGRVADLVPGIGAPAVRALGDAGSRLGLLPAVAAFVPASLYAEGLVRAFDRLSVRGDRGRRPLRGRLGSLVLVAVTPLLLLVGLSATSGLTEVLGDGLAGRLVGVYLAFLVSWLVVSLLLALAYRGLAPEHPGARALAWGALSTGSFVAGTSLGYLLFLELDLPLGSAYGGRGPVPTAIANGAFSLLWLYVLHVMVLLGYVLTLRLSARRGHPLGEVLDRDLVKAGV